MRLLLLLGLLLSCEKKPEFKAGLYVKHIQSNCIGKIDMVLEYSETALIQDYICRVELEGESRLLKETMLTVSYDLLVRADSKSIQDYKNSLAVFAKKAEESKK